MGIFKDHLMKMGMTLKPMNEGSTRILSYVTGNSKLYSYDKSRFVPISKLKVGDKVEALNGRGDNAQGFTTIKSIRTATKDVVKIIAKGNRVLEVAKDTKLWTGSWSSMTTEVATNVKSVVTLGYKTVDVLDIEDMGQQTCYAIELVPEYDGSDPIFLGMTYIDNKGNNQHNREIYVEC